MNNKIIPLPNGDFIVDNTGVTKNEYYDILTTEDALCDHDDPKRLEFEKKRNYTYTVKNDE